MLEHGHRVPAKRVHRRRAQRRNTGGSPAQPDENQNKAKPKVQDRECFET